MLTSKQIKSLPKGDYPNWMLVKMFPDQQGQGRSAKMTIVNDAKKGEKPNFIQRLINQFTGKVIQPKRHQRKV